MHRFDSLTAYLDSFHAAGIPYFDCAVQYKGECVFRYKSGYLDPEQTKPVSGDELYHIYSCSKMITATAALMLCDAGDVELDAPLYEYIPEYRDMYVKQPNGNLERAKKPVLIWQLLAMQAGFGYDLTLAPIQRIVRETNGACPTLDVIRALAEAPLYHEPGACYRYSLAHDVLGGVIEAVTGDTLGTFAKKHIFDVLGMKNTTYLPTREQLSRLAPQYRFEKDEKSLRLIGNENVYRFGTAYESGGAGCVSTLDDCMRFLEGLRTGALLSPDMLRNMSTDRLTDGIRHTYTAAPARYGYGLGVRCPKAKGAPPPHTTDSGTAVFDIGWGGAAGAYAALDVSNGIAVYYAQHVLNSTVDRDPLIELATKALCL